MTSSEVEIRFRERAETNPIEQFPGVTRRTLVSGANVTLVEIDLADGAEVPEHTHPHEQAGTVVEGRIRIRIGDQVREIGAGASNLIPGDQPHHVQALEATRLVEVFSPVREEYAGD